MTGMRLGVIGISLAVAVALAAGIYWFMDGDDGEADDLLVVRGTIATEKIGFLDNPEVRERLAERYGLRVEFAGAGSLQIMEILQGAPGDQDFLWPASPIAIEEGVDPAPNSDEIFYSPIVLYSWAPITDALLAAGLVEVTDGTYYVTDFPRLVELIDGGTQWSEIGVPQLDGGISITTTDPTTSNSGNSFAGLLASTYNGGRVVDETTVEGVLEQVQAFYARLGPLEPSSGDLFLRFVTQGMGAYPLIAGYESSLVEFGLQSQGFLERIRGEIRILYLRPTVWSSHPLIALTPAGEELLAALKDQELLRLARERHGYRSSLFGDEHNLQALGVAGVPQSLGSAMPLPRAAVMERITAALRPDSADPTGSPVAWHLSRTPPARRIRAAP